MKKVMFAGLLVGIFMLGVVTAYIVDEWYNQNLLVLGDDSFVVSHHHYANSNTQEEYTEFVLTSNFDNQPVHTMKFRDDGKFFLDDKAVCFKDRTASDGTECPFPQIAE